MNLKTAFHRRLERSAGLLLTSLAVGASVSPTPLNDSAELPPSFDNADAVHPSRWPRQDWYQGLSSDQLNSRVEQAAAHNWDLIGARAQIVQVDARSRQAGVELLPLLDFTTNTNVRAGHSASGSGRKNDWFALLSTSHEIDFGRKNRLVLNSATTLAAASSAKRDALALTTVAGRDVS